ncbi:MAG: hypothetical protein IKJ63_08885 [Clostridia bacterium]|nr:hypothetical protein [Clostridia bacterium]MBR3955570.1 hypothetical protein [Clostridia bacterium]
MAKHLTYTNYSTGSRRGTASTVGIIVAALLIGIISVVILLATNDFDIKRALGMRTEEDTTVAAADTTLPAMAVITAPKDVYSFLLICGDDGEELSFMAEITVTLSTAEIAVNAVSPQQLLTYNGRMLTVEEMFRAHSYDLVSCYRENSNLAFDKYLRLTTSRFKRLMAELGPITVDIEYDIPYVIDEFTYTFRKGENSMTSDLLLKYMTLSATGEALLVNQEKALCTLLETHFTDALVDGGEDYFSSFITYFNTDISIYDYLDAADIINTLLRSDPTIASF